MKLTVKQAYPKHVIGRERHEAPATSHRPRTGVLTFLVLAYVRVSVAIEVTEDALVVSLAAMPEAHTPYSTLL